MAVRLLRRRLGDTQQAFAQRIVLAISTVVRYEHNRPPKGKALAMFEQLATRHGHGDLADVFRKVLQEELGLDYILPGEVA